MSAEILRRAADQIRDDQEDIEEAANPRSPKMIAWLAVADLLVAAARNWDGNQERYATTLLWNYMESNSTETVPTEFKNHVTKVSAEFADGKCRELIKVARAYLGGDL